MTERPGVILQELSTDADDVAYHESYNVSRPEITVYDPEAYKKHVTLADTRKARLTAGNKLRMAVWDSGIFVGSVNATPKREGVEIGYWTDSRHAGHGYATLAAKALGSYMAQSSKRVYAEVVEGNNASARVLERAGYKQIAKEAGRLIFELGKSPETVTKPTVRDTKIGDAEALKPILENWIRDRHTGELLADEVASVMKAIDESVQGQNGKKYVVAEDSKGNVVGVMGMTTPGEDMRPYTTTSSPIEFINAYVNPVQRGTGIGKLLAKELEDRAISAGYTEVIVNSGPRYKDTGWSFWSSLYGEPIAVQKDLYGPGGDAPVWRKSFENAE